MPGLWYDPPVAFARWDPIRDLLAFQQRLDRFAPGPSGWSPPIDLHETSEAYVLVAELPGLRKDDLRIDVAERHITLSGARLEPEGACERYHRIERGHGSFTRTIDLDLPIDIENVAADLRDGVLTVTCPKSEAGARRIQIS
jgi:HSP20 family protein